MEEDQEGLEDWQKSTGSGSESWRPSSSGYTGGSFPESNALARNNFIVAFFSQHKKLKSDPLTLFRQ